MRKRKQMKNEKKTKAKTKFNSNSQNLDIFNLQLWAKEKGYITQAVPLYCPVIYSFTLEYLVPLICRRKPPHICIFEISVKKLKISSYKNI